MSSVYEEKLNEMKHCVKSFLVMNDSKLLFCYQNNNCFVSFTYVTYVHICLIQIWNICKSMAKKFFKIKQVSNKTAAKMKVTTDDLIS